jgi:hypothetical protein
MIGAGLRRDGAALHHMLDEGLPPNRHRRDLANEPFRPEGLPAAGFAPLPQASRYGKARGNEIVSYPIRLRIDLCQGQTLGDPLSGQKAHTSIAREAKGM